MTPAFWTSMLFVLNFMGLAAYFHGIFWKQVRPHPITWLAFTCVTATATIRHYFSGAEIDIWLSYPTIVLCIVIFLLGLRANGKNITRSDLVSLAIGLLALALWVLDSAVDRSVFWLSISAVSAFYPTFRKSWLKPWEESATSYFLSALKDCCALLAMTSVFQISALYPAALLVTNTAFVAFVIVRRRALAHCPPLRPGQ